MSDAPNLDAIDTLAGIAPGSPVDAIRRRKPITRDNAQASFDALFAPSDTSQMSPDERAAIALFLAHLLADSPAIAFYAAMLTDTGLRAAIEAAAPAAAAHGPYGHYPKGPLTAEDQPGPAFILPDPHRTTIGPRLAAALEHTHMLVFHLRDAAPEHLRLLEAAGWSTQGIVTLSQLVAFLSFQLRAAIGLRTLEQHPANR